MHVHHRGQERRVGSYVRRRTLLGGAGENPNQFPPSAAAHIVRGEH